MNIFPAHKNKKPRAQAMMEFALVLPILLLLLYGLLETGRLLFIYASTITAARQAARYGSATGDNPNLTPVKPYYNDCAGIEAAARRVGFINNFQDVIISYDGGLNSGTGNVIALSPAPADPACEHFIPTGNGNRIIVEVTAQWSPIVPIVPLKPFLISSTSERTILTSVGIYVAGDPPDFNAAGDGKPYLVSVVPDQLTYSAVGQVIHYTYNMRNTGLGDLASATIVDNKIVGVVCATGPFIPEATFTCTGDYVITQADLDAGTFLNKAYPTGWASNAMSAIITATPLPAISLEKSGPIAAAPKVGTKVPYTYKITNTGNVTLTSAFSVTDNRIPNVSCPAAAAIAPNAYITCTGEDAVTEEDINVGLIFNQAIASVPFKTTTVTSNPATFTVITPPIILEVTSPDSVNAPGEQTFTFRLDNNTGYDASNVNLTTDPQITFATPCDTTIPSGGNITCNGTYTFSQTDIDTHSIFEISSVAKNATINGATVSSNSYISKVAITRTPSLTSSKDSLVVSPSANPLIDGSKILYTYILENTGNVTLNTPTVTVTDGNGLVLNSTTIVCPTEIAPHSTGECKVTYPVSAIDLTAGSITTIGTPSAKFSDGTDPDPDNISAAPITVTTPTYNGPRFNIGVTVNPLTVTAIDSEVEFTYTFTNTGSIELVPASVTASLTPITFDCSLAAPFIPVGGSTSCKGKYIVKTAGPKINTISDATVKNKDNAAIVTHANNLSPNPSATVTANIVNCPLGLTLTGPTTNSYTASWNITNASGITLHLSKIEVKWDKAANAAGDLKSISLTPYTPAIWSGTNSSGALVISGNWDITNSSAPTLSMVFSKSPAIGNITKMTLSFVEEAAYSCGPLSKP